MPDPGDVPLPGVNLGLAGEYWNLSATDTPVQRRSWLTLGLDGEIEFGARNAGEEGE